MGRQKIAEIATKALRSKFAKWAICGTIGFIAEHGAQKAYDKYVMNGVDSDE